MQFVEISGEGRHISSKRGFLVVSLKGEELGKIPLDRVAAVIGAAHGITISQTLLSRLAKRNIPYVVCDKSFTPVSIVWPMVGHHAQSRVIKNQISASKPLQKRLWQTLVVAKIEMQSAVLKSSGQPVRFIHRLARKVRSGDPDNCEAQAARHYWRVLFGEDFRRSRNGRPPNDMLNYGYTIIRSAMARAVSASGLHPSIGVFHSNQANPFVLIDDLIEPFRPLVDLVVKSFGAEEFSLDSNVKKILVNILQVPLSGQDFRSTVLSHMQYLAQSLSKSFCESKCLLTVPHPTELEWAQLASSCRR